MPTDVDPVGLDAVDLLGVEDQIAGQALPDGERDVLDHLLLHEVVGLDAFVLIEADPLGVEGLVHLGSE